MLTKIKQYFYEVDLAWNSERTGKLRSLGLPELEVMTLPEFHKGKKNRWTSEHMLAGAVSSSFMSSFLGIAESTHLDIIEYKSHCFFKLGINDGMLEASEILLRPAIKLISEKDLTIALHLIEVTKGACPIINALKIKTQIHPQFEFMESIRLNNY